MKQNRNLTAVIIVSLFTAILFCSIMVKLSVRSDEIPWVALSVMGFPLFIMIFGIVFVINGKICKSEIFAKYLNKSIIKTKKVKYHIGCNYNKTKNIINKNKILKGAFWGGTIGSVIIARNLYGLIISDESTAIFYLPIFYIPTFILSLPWSLMVLLTDSNITNQIAISFGSLFNGIILGGFLGYMKND